MRFYEKHLLYSTSFLKPSKMTPCLSLNVYRFTLTGSTLSFDWITSAVASNITLLLMPTLLGYCQRHGRFSQDYLWLSLLLPLLQLF